LGNAAEQADQKAGALAFEHRNPADFAPELVLGLFPNRAGV